MPIPKEYSTTVDLGHVFVNQLGDSSLPHVIATEVAIAARHLLDRDGYRVKQEQDDRLRKYKVTITVTEEVP